jgi:hypothetical protein
MYSSLLTERPLLISPTLAATIGLEEAVMLQGLSELISFRPAIKNPRRTDLNWIELTEQELLDAFPFWATIDIKRVQTSLQNLGLIVLDQADSAAENFLCAIDEVSEFHAKESYPSQFDTNISTARPAIPPVDKKAVAQASRPAGTASLIPSNWQPGVDWIKQCRQHNIPEAFILGLVAEFVSYWRDRAQARFSWGNAFYKHVLKEWRNEQTRQGAFEKASTMSAEWHPSDDAVGILENAGINPRFIEDAIPEFVLYWRERGMVNGAWNTKFIEHIRRQWAKFSAAFGYDDTPKAIQDNWQPSADCFEILQLAEIDENYARSKIPEFVMYWKDSQQVKASWNTVFLQFIKQDWARQLKQLETVDLSHAENQSLVGSNQQRIKERFQRIADRSWAE